MNQINKRSSLLPLLGDVHPNFNQMLELLLNNQENWATNVFGANWAPTIDIKENEKQYIIRADVPGVEPKNIDVTMEGDLLTIKGHKESEKKEESEDYVHVERSQGTFCRTVTLPNAEESSKIKAKTKNGVLEIIIPKVKGSKNHKVKIEEE